MTKNHTANGRNFLIVQVEKDAHEFEMDGNELYYYATFGLPNIGHMKRLPPSNYKILFTAEEATEEQAIGVVHCKTLEVGGDESDCAGFYKNYEETPAKREWWYGAYGSFEDEPNKSLQSLIRSRFPNHEQFQHLILEIL